MTSTAYVIAAPAKVWYDSPDAQTIGDATATAASMGLVPQGASVLTTGSGWFTAREFERLGVENHRARVGASLSEMYPDHAGPSHGNDRAGSTHFDSIFWHMRHASAPVVVWKGQSTHNNPARHVVLDGAHRLAAAFLMGSSIRVIFVETAVMALL